MKERRLIKRTVDTIIIGPRHRQDLGDIPDLAASIAKVGLINPITITSEGLLIAGHRRLEACKHLGWRLISCVVADDLESAIARLTAERDENTKRKEMTFSETMSLADALYALERPKAKKRQSEAGRKFGKGIASPQVKGTYPPPHDRETDNIVGKAIGWSGTTYNRARSVAKAAVDPNLTQEQREVAKAALAEMEATGKISTGYEKVRAAIRATSALSKKSNSSTAREQRYTFNNGLPQISGIVLSLKRIEGFDPEIGIDEIDQWIGSLSKSRRDLEQIIKRLKDIKDAQVS
jgi:ParB family chromosome partitioning protein